MMKKLQTIGLMVLLALVLSLGLSEARRGSYYKVDGGVGSGGGEPAAPVASYNFESDAMTTDSTDGNDLTAGTGTPAPDTTYHKQGACSANFENGNATAYYRADGDLSSNFPFKNGTTNRTIAVTAWIKIESYGTQTRFIVDKGEETGTRSFTIGVTGSGDAETQLYLKLAVYTDSWQTDYHRTQLTANTDPAVAPWYHVGCSYNGATGAYLIHITDDGGSQVGDDRSGTFTGTAQVNAEDFTVGANDDHDGQYWDGRIDKLIIFDQVLTAAQIEAQR